MPCTYSYLQVDFNKRFDGAVSITVVLKESENKVEGLSSRLRVKHFFSPFFFFAIAKQEIFRDLHVCRRKKTTCFDLLCTCKMARLVWRYSDDAGAIIENVYKFCMEEKKSGMNLSLNRVWDRTAALTGVSRSTAQKNVEGREEGTGRAATTKATTVIYVESVTR